MPISSLPSVRGTLATRSLALRLTTPQGVRCPRSVPSAWTQSRSLSHTAPTAASAAASASAATTVASPSSSPSLSAVHTDSTTPHVRADDAATATRHTVDWSGVPVRAFFERGGGQRSVTSGSVVANGAVLSHMAGSVYAVQLAMSDNKESALSSSPSSSSSSTSAAVKAGAAGLASTSFWAKLWPRAHLEDDTTTTTTPIGSPAPLALSPIVGVGSRVFIEYGITPVQGGGATDAASTLPAPSGPPQLVGGVVARVNANCTAAVLLDDNNFDLAVPQASIRLNISRGSYVAPEAHDAMLAWLRAAGVPRRGDREFLSAVLHLRGWTASRLYLLEASDLHMIPLVSKSVRLCVLEKAEWERDHHKQMRQLLKERVKERDFRYRLTKYSGVISASMAFLGIAVAFAWNAKNFHRQQRGFQLRLAVSTLTSLFDQADAKTRSHVTTTGLREELSPTASSSASPSASSSTTAAESAGTASSAHADTVKSRVSVDAEPIAGGEGAPVIPFTRMERPEEESTLRRVLRLLDVHHPRVMVVTGVHGSGKKTLCQHCIEVEKIPALYVDVRDNEDTLRSIVRALGVENVDVCGDLLDLVAEACQTATGQWSAARSSSSSSSSSTSASPANSAETSAAAASTALLHAVKETPRVARTTTTVLSLSETSSAAPLSASSTSTGASRAGRADGDKTATTTSTSADPARVPLIVLKLQHTTGLKKVYNEAVALACDRRVCHIMVLLPLESLTMANLTMPRLDFYVVPIFNEKQAFQYTQHAIDPVSLQHFVQTVGTNGNDLDELFAAVHQRQLTASEHAVQMLQRAMHQLTEACNGAESLQQAVLQLALVSFDEGQHTAVASSGLLRHPSLARIVLYDPVKDAWVFRSRMFHSAARCLWQIPEVEA